MKFSNSMILTCIIAISQSGCATINAHAPVGKGYNFQMESIGSKANVSTHCLTPEQIKVFFPGEAPPDSEKSSCYQVFFLSSSGSSINGAMKEFVNTQKEFDSILTAIVKARSPTEAARNIASTETVDNKLDVDTVVANATGAIIHDALTKNSEEVVERSESIGQQLSKDQGVEVVRQLSELKESTNIEAVKANIEAATQSIGQNL